MLIGKGRVNMPIISPKTAGGPIRSGFRHQHHGRSGRHACALILFMFNGSDAGRRACWVVDLPKRRLARPLDPGRPVIVTVAKDGTLYGGRDEGGAAALPRMRVRGKASATDLNRKSTSRRREVIYGENPSRDGINLALDGLARLLSWLATPSGTAPPSVSRAEGESFRSAAFQFSGGSRFPPEPAPTDPLTGKNPKGSRQLLCTFEPFLPAMGCGPARSAW